MKVLKLMEGLVSEVRVFADAVSLGVRFRGFHFVQPPAIESLRSPVLRTLCSQNPYHTNIVGMSSEVSHPT